MFGKHEGLTQVVSEKKMLEYANISYALYGWNL